LSASVPLSFGLMIIEFGRFLRGLDSMHTGHVGIRPGVPAMLEKFERYPLTSGPMDGRTL
jgi:hypothetical protein